MHVFSVSKKSVVIIFICVFILAGLEVCLRIYYDVRAIEHPHIARFSDLLEQAWFKPHPYLTYINRPNVSYVMSAFTAAGVAINKFGYRSTGRFDPISRDKGDATIRIAAIGGSTTFGVNSDDQVWPYLLGEYVQKRMPDKKIEIINAGVKGYSSVENLIDCQLRLIDFDPDTYILYIGVNDYMTLAPQGVFKSDYSHFRRTIWQNLSYSVVEIMPPIFLRSLVIRTILHRAGVKDYRNLLDATTTKQFRQTAGVPMHQFEERMAAITDVLLRNLTSLIGSIRSHNDRAHIIIVSFYDSSRSEYLNTMNDRLRIFTQIHKLVFADAAQKLPRDHSITYDSWHFTPAGEEAMAAFLAPFIPCD
jgi:lysophospholipase L1-like esterase